MSIVFAISEPAFRDVSLLAVAFEVEKVHQCVLILPLRIDDLKSKIKELGIKIKFGHSYRRHSWTLMTGQNEMNHLFFSSEKRESRGQKNWRPSLSGRVGKVFP